MATATETEMVKVATDILPQLKTSPLFEWNYENKARIKNNQGGTSSSKTYTVLQVILMRLIEEKKICTVVGESIPNLRKGALRDFEDRILEDLPWINNWIESRNKTERTWTFRNGSVIEFTSYKDARSARSGKRDIAFFNEANLIPYEIYKQVAMRTSSEIFIDYNPSERFYVHDEIMADPRCATFYSNFQHNPFIDDNILAYILGLEERDPEAWDVYGLGKTGNLSETIFKDVTVIDEMPETLRKRGYGMDFGYVNDPTTLYDCGLMNGNEVYIDELIYDYKLSASDINQKFVDLGVKRNRIAWADNSEPRLIDDLQAYKWKVFPATKGDGSIKYGINLLQGYKLFITKRSINILEERTKYKFKRDKKTDKITSDPIDAWNHGWDAVRYWAVMNLKPLRPGTGVRAKDIVNDPALGQGSATAEWWKNYLRNQ